MYCSLHPKQKPKKRLEEMTPEEAWSGSRPNVKHLRVFGLVCYMHVPDLLRRKLDDKSEHVVLLGYHSTSGYMLMNPKSKQIISKDVVIDEARVWDWSKKEKGSINMHFDLNNHEADETVPSPVAAEVRRSERGRQIP